MSVNLLRSNSFVRLQIGPHFIDQINEGLSQLKLPALQPIARLRPQMYLCESDAYSTLAQFRLANAGLGNRAPRLGSRRLLCPACPDMPPRRMPNNEFHLTVECPAVQGLRSALGIKRYLLQCRFDGLSKHEAFVCYLGGLSSRGDPVPKAKYLARGRCLLQLREEWFSKWL